MKWQIILFSCDILMQTELYAHPGATPPAPQILDVSLAGENAPRRFLPTFIGYEEFPGRGVSFPAEEHQHDVYHVLLYLTGSGIYYRQGRRCPAQRGTLVITSPGEKHCFGGIGPQSCGYAHVSFRLCGGGAPLSFSEYFACLSGYSGVIPAEAALSPAAVRRAEGLYAAVFSVFADDENDIDWWTAEQRILGLFAFLGESAGGVLSGSPAPLAAARRELTRRYAENISIGELAAAACLSPGHFIRSFHREYGVSPLTCQKLLRVQAAKTLLLTTGQTCKEVASAVGYSDEYQFNRAFRQVAGLSPGKFRKQEKT